MSHKRLIINADDFGFTAGVNRGILEAFRAGVVTSTSLMANGPAFDDAVALAQANSGLEIGLHINLTQGAPVSGPARVPTLTEPGAGTLHPFKAFVRRMVLGEIDRAELRGEIFAQLERVRHAGLTIAHLDTHQHIHVFRDVFECLLEAARAYHIPALRITHEPMPPGLRRFGREGLKRMVFGWNSEKYRQAAREAGIRTADHFFGVDSRVGSEPLAEFCRIVAALPDGTSELMCHPGYNDAQLAAMDSYTERRERELKALVSVEFKTALQKYQIIRIRYSD